MSIPSPLGGGQSHHNTSGARLVVSRFSAPVRSHRIRCLPIGALKPFTASTGVLLFDLDPSVAHPRVEVLHPAQALDLGESEDGSGEAPNVLLVFHRE